MAQPAYVLEAFEACESAAAEWDELEKRRQEQERKRQEAKMRQKTSSRRGFR